MKILLLIALFTINAQAYQGESIDVIYGEDNRRDLFEVRNQMWLKLADSTAGMIAKSNLKKLNQSAFQIADQKSLEVKKNVCADERFSQQTVAPVCSGFLVGPDLILTAGHCYLMFGNPEGECRDNAWVFDYAIRTQGENPAKKILARNVYNCKKIVSAKFDPAHLMDYALIQLDRKVQGHEPVKFRTRGVLPAATPLVVIGHPSGLPTKISNKGSVTYNRNKHTFSTTLDTFHVNSGSGVFNSRTGLLEGILIQGKTDYILKDKADSNSCYVLNVCDNNAKNCTAGAESGSVSRGEVVFRIDIIRDILQQAQK